MLRSQTMQYYNILFSKENAVDVLNELGSLGILHIDNLNEDLQDTQKPFSNQIKDLHQTLDKQEELENFLKEEGLIQEQNNNDDFSDFVLSKLKGDLKQNHFVEFYHNLQEEISQVHEQLMEMRKNLQLMKDKVILSSDYLNVLQNLKNNLPKDFSKNDNTFQRNEFINLTTFQFEYFAGVIETKNLQIFQKQLFRLTRGNIFCNYFPLDNYFYDSKLIHDQCKQVIILTFQKTENDYIGMKVKKLAETFNVKSFIVPNNYHQIQIEQNSTFQDNQNLNQLFISTKNQYLNQLSKLLDGKNFIEIPTIIEDKIILLRQKYIYETLNKFIIRGFFVEGRVWIPESKNQYLTDALSILETQKEFNGFRLTSLNYKLFKKVPPTKIQTNQFSIIFQEIVNTYSIPKYKEINPGLFTIISFPFLFGLMFGDIGHGFGLLIFGIYLHLYPQFFSKSILKLRSILLLMGIFSFYCGFIYNDFLSIPFPIQTSCYNSNNIKQNNCDYFFGIDYSWHHSTNYISFINSFKMKFSIIIGVIHMLLGIFLKGFNALFFKDFGTLFFEFLPQLIFMSATFGYMVICIILKWIQNYSENPSTAPSIISLFINFVTEIDTPLIGDKNFQLQVQQWLAIISGICIPIMLLGKPIIHFLNSLQQKEYKKIDDIEIINSITSDNSSDSLIINNHQNFGESLIHQGIETIEFVLGSISNTASYLRLWALSLAHSQLATVFLNMILKPNYEAPKSIVMGSVLTVLAFVMFFIVTFGVIMCMDFMECFLHALRLHWVEFQNKFYKGDGIQFEGFNFKKYIEENIQ